MVNKEEFADWKANLVTKAFFEAAEQRVEDAKEILAGSAGNDSNQDCYLRGFIQAYREMQDFRVEDE
jgi:hypothetical protein